MSVEKTISITIILLFQNKTFAVLSGFRVDLRRLRSHIGSSLVGSAMAERLLAGAKAYAEAAPLLASPGLLVQSAKRMPVVVGVRTPVNNFE